MRWQVLLNFKISVSSLPNRGVLMHPVQFCRSYPIRSFPVKDILGHFAKFTGKRIQWSLFLNEVY